MSVPSPANHRSRPTRGTDAKRRWASMNLAIFMLALSWQPHAETGASPVTVPAGVEEQRVADVQPVDPTKLLVGSPELWKFRRINVPFASR